MLLCTEEKYDGQSAELPMEFPGQHNHALLVSYSLIDVDLSIWAVLLILLRKFVVQVVEVGSEDAVALTPI